MTGERDLVRRTADTHPLSERPRVSPGRAGGWLRLTVWAAVVLLALGAGGCAPAARAQTDARWDFPDVAAAGSFVYAVAFERGLRVLDAGDPGTLREVGSLDIGAEAWSVVVSGDRAYVLGSGTWLHVIDVSDPTRPRHLGAGDTDCNLVQMAVGQGYVYCASGDTLVEARGGLSVIDVRDPTAPRQVGRYSTTTRPVDGVGTVGPYVYATVGCNRFCYTPTYDLHVLDVSDPTEPRRLTSLEGPAGLLAVSGTRAYAGGGGALHVLDVSEPARPAPIGAGRAGPGVGEADLDAQGTRAYVSSGTGWMVIDASDPLRHSVLFPHRPDRAVRSGLATRLAVLGTAAYVAAGERLLVVDTGAPPWARVIGAWNGQRFQPAGYVRLPWAPRDGASR